MDPAQIYHVEPADLLLTIKRHKRPEAAISLALYDQTTAAFVQVIALLGDKHRAARRDIEQLIAGRQEIRPTLARFAEADDPEKLWKNEFQSIARAQATRLRELTKERSGR